MKFIGTILLGGLLLVHISGWSQGITIGSTNAPHNSAVLDLQSSTKGFLPPRMSTAQRKAIPAPAAGVIVFDTDIKSLFLFDGSQWVRLSATANSTTYEAIQVPVNDSLNKTAGNFAGANVAMNEKYALVGAPGNEVGGVVYLYKKTIDGWSFVSKITAADPQSNASFGWSVAINDNYFVVGAPAFDLPGINNAGKIYVFNFGKGDSWSQQTAITRAKPAIDEQFGTSVAITTTTGGIPFVFAGTPKYSSSVTARESGIAEIYNLQNTRWTISQTLVYKDLQFLDKFGECIEAHGDYMVVGAPGKKNTTLNLEGAGAAYVYAFNGTSWALQERLAGNIARSGFGTSLSIKNNTLVVGAPWAPYSAGSTEAVTVYFRNISNRWQFVQTIYSSNSQGIASNSLFGLCVNHDDNFLLISVPGGRITPTLGSISIPGVQGKVLVYKKEQASGIFRLYRVLLDDESILFNEGISVFFGYSTAVVNGHYVIGIPGKHQGEIRRTGKISFGYFE
ncbi:hypothetical protein [Pollutibacter soli]|uniref:hypothetical protein n=1 Tax=Pollutibacter soli TaxID=3034157 RepID=UPI003013741C